MSAEALTAPTVSLNGQPLIVDGDGRLPSMEPALTGDTVVLAAASYAFILMAAADAPTCR